MPTAIDKIKEAEKRAADVRAEALQESRENIRMAQEEISREQKDKFSTARKSVRQELEAEQDEVSKQQEALSGENQKVKEEFKSKAGAGVKAAADIIVKGILDI